MGLRPTHVDENPGNCHADPADAGEASAFSFSLKSISFVSPLLRMTDWMNFRESATLSLLGCDGCRRDLLELLTEGQPLLLVGRSDIHAVDFVWPIRHLVVD
jgi:hypothetical protein